MGCFSDIDRALERVPPEVTALLAGVEEACGGLKAVAPESLEQLAADVRSAGIAGSRAAGDFVLEMGRGPLSVRTILHLHRVLLDGTGEPRAGLPADGQRGLELTELVARYELAVSQRRHPPLFLLSAFVLDFAAVEPFEVANARMAHLLLTRELLRHGYEVARYAPVDPALDEHRVWPWVDRVLRTVLDACGTLDSVSES